MLQNYSHNAYDYVYRHGCMSCILPLALAYVADHNQACIFFAAALTLLIRDEDRYIPPEIALRMSQEDVQDEDQAQ